MKKCPLCAEEIQDDAKVCRWCHWDLSLAPVPGRPIQPETSGKAIASLILGLFFIVFPLAVWAVVLGHLSLYEIKRSAGRLAGKGMARAGLILGYFGGTIFALLIIASIAIPNLFRPRGDTYASAVGSLRTLNTVAITYASTYDKGYPPSLAALGPPPAGETPSAHAAGLIDETFASGGFFTHGSRGTRSGYVFTYVPGERDADGRIGTYKIYADPIEPGNTRLNHYFTDETGIIRQETDKPANEHSPPIAG